jgi:Cu/Ag efflux pump CusA
MRVFPRRLMFRWWAMIQRIYQIADELRQRITQVPGAVDVNVHQVIDNPSLLVNIDRTRADQLGLT